MAQLPRGFKDLIAWNRAMDLAAEVYRVVRKLPRHEMFGLADQMRRASVSVPSNIAEGQARGPGEDFRRFLRMALGSLQEVQSQLLLAVRVGYLKETDLEVALGLVDEVNRLSRSLLNAVGKPAVAPNSKLQTPNLR